MTTSTLGGDYDAYPEEYARNVDWREQDGPEADPFGILPPLLDLLGDVRGRRVLDAGCGEGYLSRVLAARGALVTGADIAPSLVERARRKSPAGIDYLVADLSEPQPGLAGSFDLVASYLVLNDVPGYQGFAATIAAALMPGGSAVLAFNNPYAGALRGHATDYFATGTRSPYKALWEAGIRAYFYHRTLEEYLDAFLGAGLRLAKLADLTALAGEHRPDGLIPDGHRFPRFMILAFAKP
ncbi:MAG TPA: methyltransferase domain-containing protein [Streptosporangiaceae bacterium]|jgi:2-polyprenyl-3-methyl-5-hydroxy-6-metoxy-1,4-benzoquinol methylase